MTGEAAWGRGRHWNTVGPPVQPHPPLDRNAIGNTAIMRLASFMVVIPSADLSAAAGNPFLLGVLGRRQQVSGSSLLASFPQTFEGRGYCANL